jgi:hypothetical protein
LGFFSGFSGGRLGAGRYTIRAVPTGGRHWPFSSGRHLSFYFCPYSYFSPLPVDILLFYEE